MTNAVSSGVGRSAAATADDAGAVQHALVERHCLPRTRRRDWRRGHHRRRARVRRSGRRRTRRRRPARTRNTVRWRHKRSWRRRRRRGRPHRRRERRRHNRSLRRRRRRGRTDGASRYGQACGASRRGDAAGAVSPPRRGSAPTVATSRPRAHRPAIRITAELLLGSSRSARRALVERALRNQSTRSRRDGGTASRRHWVAAEAVVGLRGPSMEPRVIARLFVCMVLMTSLLASVFGAPTALAADLTYVAHPAGGGVAASAPHRAAARQRRRRART